MDYAPFCELYILMLIIRMSVALFLSIILDPTGLIAPASTLLVTAIFYAGAAIKGQPFTSSKALGGQGIAQQMLQVILVRYTIQNRFANQL